METKKMSDTIKAKRLAKKVTLAQVAKAVGKNPTYVAAALTGNHRLTPDEAKKVGKLLGLDTETTNSLTKFPVRTDFPTTTDPFKYRLLEVIGVYGDALREMANEMFGDGIRLAGLDLVTRLHIREGMPLCVSVIEPNRWGGGKRLPKCLECLVRYGTHAREVLPQLREIRRNTGKLGESAGGRHDPRALRPAQPADVELLLPADHGQPRQGSGARLYFRVGRGLQHAACLRAVL